MTVPWTLTFDCADGGRVAAFWTVALGYVEAPPPMGWDTWEDWLRDFEVPGEEWADGASLCDPEGVLPRIGFLKVPKGKTAKNRLHLDLPVAGGRHVPQPEREAAIRAHVARLVEAGGTVQQEVNHGEDLDHVVMQDPEGNEFCVV